MYSWNYILMQSLQEVTKLKNPTKIKTHNIILERICTTVHYIVTLGLWVSSLPGMKSLTSQIQDKILNSKSFVTQTKRLKIYLHKMQCNWYMFSTNLHTKAHLEHSTFFASILFCKKTIQSVILKYLFPFQFSTVICASTFNRSKFWFAIGKLPGLLALPKQVLILYWIIKLHVADPNW